ncbi:NDP-sugar synthase [Candidatus Peregrinibacteria bacterium]|nr:NDP-sugar synthase [Candidatus Peregrinibacteria bacterium]
MKAFILAGGFATRLWPLTEHRAKPLLPLAGKPILSHLVEKIPAEIPVTVSTNAVFAEGFSTWKRGMNRANLEIVVEDTKKDDHKLGALGATAKWISETGLTEDLLLLTGDNYLGFSMEDFLVAYRPGTPLLAAYDIKDRAKASVFGTVILKASSSGMGPPSPTLPPMGEGRSETINKKINSPLPPRGRAGVGVGAVLAFEEKPAQAKTSLVSTGCSIIPKGCLSVLLDFAKSHPDNVGGIFEEFLRRGIPVECFTFTEPWLDIGSFPAYLEAHRLLVSGPPIVHPESRVEGSTLKGSIVVGARSKVIDSTLADTMIFDDCILEDCVLRDCIMDEGCVLKGVDLNGKMLRAGTWLEP